MTASASAAASRQYRLDLGPVCFHALLTANQRLHWAARARRTRDLRRTAGWLARAQRIPAGHLTVGLEYAPGDRRRRDPDNLVSTLKPCVFSHVRYRNAIK